MSHLFHSVPMLHMIYPSVKAKCTLVADTWDTDTKNLPSLVSGKLETCLLWLPFAGFGICRVPLISSLSISIGSICADRQTHKNISSIHTSLDQQLSRTHGTLRVHITFTYWWALLKLYLLHCQSTVWALYSWALKYLKIWNIGCLHCLQRAFSKKSIVLQ